MNCVWKPPPHKQVIESRDNDLSETEGEETTRLSQGIRDESDWIPESPYLQRKLQSDKTIDDVAYALCSRLVSRSGQKP
jgi:hypothetical protein